MYKFILSACFLVIANLAHSAPTVTKALIGDNGIEIQGSNFGGENPMLFWDDAKEPFLADSNQHLDIVPKVSYSKWADNAIINNEGFRYFNSIETKTGKKDVFYQGKGHKTFLGIPNHPKVASLKTKLFISWWYKPGLSPSGEGGSNKFLRVWDDSNGRGTRISWTQMHFTCGADKEYVKWGSWNGNVGKWNHHMAYIDLENRSVRTWVNGALIHDAECAKHPDYANTPLYVGLVGFDHGSGGYRSMTTAIDDIYIGSSQARVEISESPTWSATMAKEILPIRSWSDSKILTKLHDGIIKHSKNIYVYVIDENGVYNTKGIQAECGICPRAIAE